MEVNYTNKKDILLAIDFLEGVDKYLQSLNYCCISQYTHILLEIVSNTKVSYFKKSPKSGSFYFKMYGDIGQ